jgi:2-oxoglutarate/2-oxoacid ferredoxin oxidoreductase subunit alpha
MFPAPDEITVLQWMAGLSACGHLPVTATSFPGFRAYAGIGKHGFHDGASQWLLYLVQRLGPATGTATCGAQGDISLLAGMISGGHRLPVLMSI